ncbi:hypothetical protein JCR33_22985 [Acuticoccus sp. 2012]|uniref:Uncharacterized protein n=2 Tax=Acuticoccus mangrovi TaxID=2796142 RepID=A0A934MJ64_9HYPH|nr:hypothetical protein [Acuticoccus mangrovi]
MLPWPARYHHLPRFVLRGLVPPRKVPILIVGMSHTNAVAHALDHTPDRRFGIINLRQVKVPEDTAEMTAKETRASLRIRRRPIPLFARFAPTVVVSMVGGANHHMLGLFEHAEPFDFEMPGAPDVLPGRRRLTYAEVRAVFEFHVHNSLDTIALLRRYYGKPVLHISAPPPTSDEAHIRRTLAPTRGDAVARQPLTPAPIRMKMYLLQNQILREHCAANDITFVEPPAEALDDDGFLAEPYRSFDPVHGNVTYGQLVIRDILRHPVTVAALGPSANEATP